MLPTLYAEFALVALSFILVPDVYSQSFNCGIVSRDFTNAEGAWPWMVAITKEREDGSYDPLCNGFLIDRRHVLSTATCFTGNYDVGDFMARIGKMNQNEGEEYEIKCITTHPRFNTKQYYNDIAILTLSRDVHTPDYTPLCLQDDVSNREDLVGLVATKVAWGMSDFRDFFVPTLKQVPGLRIISNRECTMKFKTPSGSLPSVIPDGVKSEMLCAENTAEQRDLCLGDSGGPLMYQDNKNRWTAVGIVSFGFPCGTKGEPEGYTRVSKYVEWIRENTRGRKGDCR